MPPSNDFWLRLDSLLLERKQLGLTRQNRVWTPLSPRLMADEVGRQFVNFGSNDYLSLSWHPDVRQASHDVPNRTGSGASPLVTGYTNDHNALARAIANFELQEDAILFASGFAANVGTVSALATKEDVIFSDQLNHASLIDGCRLSRATIHVYPHNDMNALTDLVRAHRKNGKQAFVVSDSLFSMDGDIALLEQILELCKAYDMMSIIDEAHATGVYGKRGTGLIEEMSLDSDRWIRTGTLSKAIGCMGGFVSGPKQLTNWLCNAARSYIYSTSAPSHLVKSAKKSIELIPSMTQQRIELRTRSRNLRARLRELGFRVGGDDSPIIAIYVEGGRSTSHVVKGSSQWSQTVMAWSHKLQESGLFVPGIRPPTVPEAGCLLRVSLNTSHTDEDLDRLVQVLAT